MRLHERYRPRSLDDIVGQPGVIGRLRAFVANPEPSILLFEGSTGSGKTTAAIVLSELLACTDWFGASVYKLNGADLSADTARSYFDPHQTPFRYKIGSAWHVLRIEELEWVSAQTMRYLKEAMEEAQRRWRVVIIATSNDASKLDKALRHRFRLFTFSGGPYFAEAARDRLCWIWQQETGNTDLPVGFESLGWEDNEFSMRCAIDGLENYFASRREMVPA